MKTYLSHVLHARRRQHLYNIQSTKCEKLIHTENKHYDFKIIKSLIYTRQRKKRIQPKTYQFF